MNIRQTVHIPRRVLSLALCAAMVLTLLPLPARAEGICAHHPEHTADCGYQAAVEGQDCTHSHDDSCGYQEASPCTHSHDDACGYREASNCTHQHTEEGGENGESCTHSHDGSCGYQEAENCTHSHDDACGYREARTCTHTHDNTCGYVEAVAGSPCTYQCKLCAQQENAQDLCAHGNAPDACEDCASDARVASVQKLIDALPETVTEENREAAQSALSAVDTAKSALAEAEQAKLTLTRYTALKALLAEQDSPDTGKVITDWTWVDPDEWLEEDGSFIMPGVTEDSPAYFEDVVEYLPLEVTTDAGEVLTLGDWTCEDYPMEDGTSQGEFVFTTTLPEGYILSDGSNVLRLNVTVAPMDLSEGPEAAGYATVDYMTWNGTGLTSATCNSATEVTGSEIDTAITWGQDGQDTWYVVNSNVTIGKTDSDDTFACITVKGDVHLILVDGCSLTIKGNIQVMKDVGTLTIYGQSAGSGKLNVENSSSSSSSSCYDAAIGGQRLEDSMSEAGSITIHGGTINATSNGFGAAIGASGRKDSGGEYGTATVTIHGGTVTATANSCSAAIGGGSCAHDYYGTADVTINGGTINATATSGGAAIGGGRWCTGNVTINGGTINATSENEGAAIGGGRSSPCNVIISGGKIKAKASEGAAIGSGYGGACETSPIEINGGEIYAEASSGAAIGGGSSAGQPVNVTITGGKIEAHGSSGAGIGTGYGANSSKPSSVTIKGGEIFAEADTGAGIGSGSEAVTVMNYVNVSISDGTVTARTNYIRNTDCGAAIGGGGAYNRKNSSQGNITISGGTVKAYGTNYAPGIGNAPGGTAKGKIKISGGNVTAEGGLQAAGIGSGNYTKAGKIEISGGTVEAKGGEMGAGIGTGAGDKATTYLGTVSIQGGTVNAAGGKWAAGIGGGHYVGGNGSITISGGTVTATRGDQSDMTTPAADIGHGGDATSSGINFTLNGTAWTYVNNEGTYTTPTKTAGFYFLGKNGTVYGSQTLPSVYCIASDESLTVPEGASLNTGSYNLYVNGTLSGAERVTGNVYCRLTLTDCTATGTTTNYSGTLYGKAGASFTLSPSSKPGYTLDKWTTTPANLVSDNSFTMPAQATTVKANLIEAVKITGQPESKTITYLDNVTLSVIAENSSGTAGGITYQWYKDGTSLERETSATLSLKYLDANTVPYTFYCAVTYDGVTVNSNEATVTVNKAAGRVTINNDPGKTYDGKPASTEYTYTGSGSVTKVYKVKGADDSTYTKTAPTDAGSYTVRVTLTESQNFTGASDTKDFTISKATDNEWLTSPAVTDFTYGATVTSPVAYQAKYGNGNVVVTYKKQGTEDNPSTDVPKDAGTYDVTVSLAETASYPGLDDVKLTLTISKVAPAFTAPTGKTVVYTGKALELTEGAETSHGTMQYRLGEEGEWSTAVPKATDCGTYTVWYKVVGDNNHTNTEPASVTAKILPFAINEEPQDTTINYGENTALTFETTTALEGEVTYQWCLVTVEVGKEIYTPLEGETSSELTLTKPNAGTYVYACIVTCGDYSETSAKATVTVTPVEIPAGPGTGIDLSGFWLEGGEAPASENQTKIPEKSPSSRLLTKYTYNGTSNDAHQNYPTGMQIYSVETDDQGNTTVAPVAELGNLLRYSGCSIRITGKPGIRMITSLTKEAKAALTKANLAGYTLEEYGTVAVWSSDLDNQPLTLNTKKSRSNYAYKRGVSDPVFANVGALTQYTNVLVWDSLEDKKYDEDIDMRPYIKLSKGGETVTLYGGTVSRSIGYVAQQNANTFAKGTAGYKYVHEIIDKVNALNSSTGTNTTTGGNG